jgi:hypothetical protein
MENDSAITFRLSISSLDIFLFGVGPYTPDPAGDFGSFQLPGEPSMLSPQWPSRFADLFESLWIGKGMGEARRILMSTLSENLGSFHFVSIFP